MVSFTVILTPFRSLVALAMSSPNFYGDRCSGLIFWGREDVALTAPHMHLRYMTLILVVSNLGGLVEVAGVG